MGEQSFGKYELLNRIAVGGMAEVFRAKAHGEASFEKTVAIKRIHPSFTASTEFVNMFIDEAKIAASLSHGNIVHIFDLGRVGEQYFIAMELVEGFDTRRILEELKAKGRRGLPYDVAAYIVSEVSRGLDYAHRKTGADGRNLGIIHRDISPSNVLVSFEGEVKIVDFGIAKAEHKLSRTRTGALKGKYCYLSPEAVRGQGIDQRSDIFSAGAVLYELVTGRRLFDGKSEIQILERIRDGTFRRPSHHAPDIPAALERIILGAIEPDRTKRFQTAGEFAAALQGYLHSLLRPLTGEDMSALLRDVMPRADGSGAGGAAVEPGGGAAGGSGEASSAASAGAAGGTAGAGVGSLASLSSASSPLSGSRPGSGAARKPTTTPGVRGGASARGPGAAPPAGGSSVEIELEPDPDTSATTLEGPEAVRPAAGVHAGSRSVPAPEARPRGALPHSSLDDDEEDTGDTPDDEEVRARAGRPPTVIDADTEDERGRVASADAGDEDGAEAEAEDDDDDAGRHEQRTLIRPTPSFPDRDSRTASRPKGAAFLAAPTEHLGRPTVAARPRTSADGALHAQERAFEGEDTTLEGWAGGGPDGGEASDSAALIDLVASQMSAPVTFADYDLGAQPTLIGAYPEPPAQRGRGGARPARSGTDPAGELRPADLEAYRRRGLAGLAATAAAALLLALMVILNRGPARPGAAGAGGAGEGVRSIAVPDEPPTPEPPPAPRAPSPGKGDEDGRGSGGGARTGDGDGGGGEGAARRGDGEDEGKRSAAEKDATAGAGGSGESAETAAPPGVGSDDAAGKATAAAKKHPPKGKAPHAKTAPAFSSAGFLTLGAVPYAAMSVDGTSVGRGSKLSEIKVSAGKHTVLFSNVEMGLKKAVPIDVSPGGHHSITVSGDRWEILVKR
ncbi:MAG TPA: serine/threonine-protein kinase [Myxococcota bacterium]|nr:serine/threonine-protein kinase [Myxococcota bacterium]